MGVKIILNKKVTVVEIKHYQLKNVLSKLEYSNLKNNLKKSGTWKIQLTIASKVISPIDNNEQCVMYSRSENRETIITDKPDEVI